MHATRTYTPEQFRALRSVLRAVAASIRSEATRADAKYAALRHEDSTDEDIANSDAELLRALRLGAELHVVESASNALSDADDNDSDTVTKSSGYDLAVVLAYNMAMHMNLVPQETITACRGALREW